MKLTLFYLTLGLFLIGCPPSKQTLVTREQTNKESGIISTDLIFPADIDTIRDRRILIKISSQDVLPKTQSLQIQDTYTIHFSLFNIPPGEDRFVEILVFDDETKFLEFRGAGIVDVRPGETTSLKIDLIKNSVSNYCKGVVGTNLIFSKNPSDLEVNDSVNLILEFDNPKELPLTFLWIAKTPWMNQDTGLFSSIDTAQTMWVAPSSLVAEEVEFNFEIYILEKDTLTMCDIYKNTISLEEKESTPLEEDTADICEGIDLLDDALIIEDDDIHANELVNLTIDPTKIINSPDIHISFHFSANGGTFVDSGESKHMWQAPLVSKDTEYSLRFAIGPINEDVICAQQEKRIIVKP